MNNKDRKISVDTDDSKKMFSEMIRKIFDEAIVSEFDQLTLISQYTESLEDKLKYLYQNKFPKTCNSCQKVFLTREDFLAETSKLKRGGTIFDARGLQEFRDCTCGSTLMVRLKEDRRDESEFGIMRRQIFDAAYSKLSDLSDLPELELKQILRDEFSRIIKEVITASK